jgi:hypothetical protein
LHAFDGLFGGEQMLDELRRRWAVRILNMKAETRSGGDTCFLLCSKRVAYESEPGFAMNLGHTSSFANSGRALDEHLEFTW